MLRLAATLLLAACAQAATVTGTVYLRADTTRRPLEGASVLARAADGNELLQTVPTDAEGRYLLRDLPNKKISLSASRPGYTSLAIAGAEPSLLLDLGADEAVANADFDMLPGGVITGRVTDAAGDPLENVQVAAWRIMHFGGDHRAAGPSATTDDRGIYRIFGLDAGRYVLLARSMNPLRDAGLPPAYFPGTPQESRAREIEIIPGAELAGMDIAMGAGPSYTIAGRIIGVDREQIKQVSVFVSSAELNSAAGIGRAVSADEAGSFRFLGLPAGTYSLTAFLRGGPTLGTPALARQVIELRSDLSGLIIHPTRPGHISGRVIFSQFSGRSKPESVAVRLSDTGRGIGFRPPSATASAPDYKFDFADVPPGGYLLRLAALLPGAYLKKQGASLLETPEVTLVEGESATIDLEVAFGLARVSGVAKAPGTGAPLAEARVGLTSIPATAKPSAASMQFRTAKADQRGRWEIGDVPPGEYRICAWPSLAQEALYAPETWDRAGASVKRLIIEANAQIDVELTAATPESGQAAPAGIADGPPQRRPAR